MEEGVYKEGALLAGTWGFYLCSSFFFAALLGKFLIVINEFMQRWLLQYCNTTALTVPCLFLMDMAALSWVPPAVTWLEQNSCIQKR